VISRIEGNVREREEKDIADFLFVSLFLRTASCGPHTCVITSEARTHTCIGARGDAYLAQAFLFIFCKYSE